MKVRKRAFVIVGRGGCLLCRRTDSGIKTTFCPAIFLHLSFEVQSFLRIDRITAKSLSIFLLYYIPYTSEAGIGTSQYNYDARSSTLKARPHIPS